MFRRHNIYEIGLEIKFKLILTEIVGEEERRTRRKDEASVQLADAQIMFKVNYYYKIIIIVLNLNEIEVLASSVKFTIHNCAINIGLFVLEWSDSRAQFSLRWPGPHTHTLMSV